VTHILEVPSVEQLIHLVYGDVDAQAEWVRSLDPVYCQVHGVDYEHRPRPLRFVVHHVLPLGMGGLGESDNWVITCDTGHFNIHRLLGDLIRSQTMRTLGTSRERSLAVRAYRQWISAGKPGRPVFEVW
jgi:hypothetical protein